MEISCLVRKNSMFQLIRLNKKCQLLLLGAYFPTLLVKHQKLKETSLIRNFLISLIFGLFLQNYNEFLFSERLLENIVDPFSLAQFSKAFDATKRSDEHHQRLYQMYVLFVFLINFFDFLNYLKSIFMRHLKI